MTQKLLRMAVLATALALAACGGSSDPSTDAEAPAPGTILDSAAQAAEETGAAAAIPQPDPDKPLSSYPELTSGQQVMFMYVAASRMPPDFEQLASTFSREYRQSNDAFRKNDLMQAIKPQLEQGIAQAADHPYAWVEVDDASLGSYDFERGGFTVGEFTRDHYRYFNDVNPYEATRFGYTWANRDQFAFAPVADEAVARKLESMRTQRRDKPRLKVYFFAQSADLNQDRVHALVTRVQITDRNGNVLFEYGPDTSAANAAGQP